jgi:hypothetical protein
MGYAQRPKVDRGTGKAIVAFLNTLTGPISASPSPGRPIAAKRCAREIAAGVGVGAAARALTWLLVRGIATDAVVYLDDADL